MDRWREEAQSRGIQSQVKYAAFIAEHVTADKQTAGTSDLKRWPLAYKQHLRAKHEGAEETLQQEGSAISRVRTRILKAVALSKRSRISS